MNWIGEGAAWVQENRLLWCVHLAAVLFMTGLIWLIQVVQYPLMAEVDLGSFPGFHASHSARITWIVLPVMLTELTTAALLVWSALQGSRALPLAVACLALSGLVFLATGFLSVPAHQVLSLGFDPQAHQKLVSTNWIRTGVWTLHSLLLLWVTHSALAGSLRN